MKKAIVLTVILAILLTLTACGEKAETAAEPTAAPEATAAQATPAPVAEPEAAEEEADSTYVISAFGLELKYPEKWKDKVTVDVAEDRAAFSCGDIKLFDLVINSDEGFVLGTVRGDEYTVISVVDYPIESNDMDVLAMQEDMNVILNNLINDYDFVVGEALEKEDTSTFDIETSVVTMKYPAKWQEKVQVEVKADGVYFSNNGTKLFDLMFVECDGYLLGTYGDTPIYIVDYPVDSDEQAAMQEDVNVILQYLMEDPEFEING